jgi:sugar fermentation stimulation protein A
VTIFENIIPATFLARPNRFVVLCDVGGRTVNAYLPNPGRLWELLFPGTTVYLTKFPPSQERKLTYLAVAVERDHLPIMLHTHHTNSVAAHLVRNNRIPGLEGAEIVKAENTIGGSRFDFLLRKSGKDFLLEVKSCTLVNNTLAMFPDAVSARATKHIEELAHLSTEGYGAAVLFVVHWPKALYFMPEHHTDLAFSRALYKVRDRVMVKAVSVGWNRDLSLGSSTHDLAIPWDLVDRESHDRGSYIIVLRLPRDRKIEVGALGAVKFRKGFYLYVGSAMKDLTQRLDRHKRLIKNRHWHIDYLREHAEYIAGIPIRTSVDIECEIAGALSGVAEWQVPGFGCSDCGCQTHLVGMADDPFLKRPFSDLLLRFRMGLLEEELSNRAFTRR